MDFQKHSDNFFDKVFSWAIPTHIRPNHITLLRLLILPFLVHFLIVGSYLVAGTLFLIGNITDALDGAIARKRGQITEIGKLFDPIADRFLILSTALILVWRFISWQLFAILLVLELYQSYKANKLRDNLRRPVPANWAGKIKMIIHFLALLLLFLATILDSGILKTTAEIGLYVSLPFLIAEPFSYHAEKTPEEILESSENREI